MKRTRVFGVMVTAALVSGCWFVTECIQYSGGGKTEDTKVELLTLAKAIQSAALHEPITPSDWEKISDMQVLAPHIAPRMEQGERSIYDRWGNLFIFEKRDQGDEIIITIRSSHEIPRQWYERDKGILGIECTISRSDGLVSEPKRLWRN